MSDRKEWAFTLAIVAYLFFLVWAGTKSQQHEKQQREDEQTIQAHARAELAAWCIVYQSSDSTPCLLNIIQMQETAGGTLK